jgi:hypothetical protein
MFLQSLISRISSRLPTTYICTWIPSSVSSDLSNYSVLGNSCTELVTPAQTMSTHYALTSLKTTTSEFMFTTAFAFVPGSQN